MLYFCINLARCAFGRTVCLLNFDTDCYDRCSTYDSRRGGPNDRGRFCRRAQRLSAEQPPQESRDNRTRLPLCKRPELRTVCRMLVLIIQHQSAPSTPTPPTPHLPGERQRWLLRQSHVGRAPEDHNEDAVTPPAFI